MTSFFRSILPVFAILIAFASPAMAATGHDHLPPSAEAVFEIGPLVVTNSMIMVWIVAALLILIAQLATRNISIVPSGFQNFVEWVVESVVDEIIDAVKKVAA